MGPPATAATAAASSSADTSAENTDHYIDAVVSVGAKDLPLLRYSLRHMLRYVANLHTVFVVTQDTITAKSVVAQANAFQTAHTKALPRVELFPSRVFPSLWRSCATICERSAGGTAQSAAATALRRTASGGTSSSS